MDSALLNFRGRLRRIQTASESKLWKYLRSSHLGVRFKRQIIFGNYIVDFYCPSRRLVVELDGEQHKWRRNYDEMRTKYLRNLGIKVIRSWNGEVDSNLNEVLEKIRKSLTSPAERGASLS